MRANKKQNTHREMPQQIEKINEKRNFHFEASKVIKSLYLCVCFFHNELCNFATWHAAKLDISFQLVKACPFATKHKTEFAAHSFACARTIP